MLNNGALVDWNTQNVKTTYNLIPHEKILIKMGIMFKKVDVNIWHYYSNNESHSKTIDLN